MKFCILFRRRALALGVASLLGAAIVQAADVSGRKAGCSNPVLPGYFGDPSVVQFEGKNYIYATLDPFGAETLGCWESSDFKNWTYRELNWPTKTACTSEKSGNAMVWAPSVVHGPDGRFHMAVSVGNEVWLGVADQPLGPWKNALGNKPFIPYDYKPGFHMIDAEYFVDDDGSVYLYWGSGWGWKNGRCFAAKMGKDMSSFDGEVLDVTPSYYFEGPIMVKRHGLYFLMYSDGITIKDTYQVHYAVGTAPFGPFEEGSNSPILVTDRSKNVISPGHHTVFRRDGQDYIMYHRHSIPFDPDFVGRQICVEPLVFTADGRIETVVPTHEGPALVQGREESISLALGISVTASSQLDDLTGPACAADDNFATRWAASSDDNAPWLQIDLGKKTDVTRHILRPEYAWKAYAFKLEASSDGKKWKEIRDFTAEPVSGSPIIIKQSVKARYFRLVFPKDSAVGHPSLFEWTLL